MTYTLIIGTASLGAFIAYFIFRWLDNRARQAFALRNVPYIPQKNIFISTLQKERTEVKLHETIQKEGKKIFGSYVLGSPTIVVANPEILGLVFSKEFTSFTNRRVIKFDDPIYSSILSNAKDDQWKRLRACVTPAFSAGSLRKMKPRIDETVHKLLNNFENQIQNFDSEIEVKELFGAFTMDTILAVAFGSKVDSLAEPDNPIIVNARKVFSTDMSVKQLFSVGIIFLLPKLAKLLGLKLNKEPVEFFQSFSEEIIKRKKAELKMDKESHGKASSFLELILEAEAEQEKLGNDSEKSSSKFMSTTETVAQCILFFLLGYDTSATTITIATYLLALHPQAQERLYEEIETEIAKLVQESDNESKDLFELITLETLPRFKYLSAVIDETLRLYSPASLSERTASKDIVLKTQDGTVEINLKKGDIVQIPIYSVHRDIEQYPSPEEFKPKRFLGDSSYSKSYSFIPFGAGPRNCVAKGLALMEVKLALIHVLRVYKFTRCDKTKVPFEMYFVNNFISPRDIILRVEKRDS